MLVFLVSVAFAGECKSVIDVPLDADTSHIVYRTHQYDVAAYAAEYRLGFRDYAPLIVDAGNGDWCYRFGSLRPFREVMGTTTGIVVTTGDKRTIRLSTHSNEFWVKGLSVGDVVRIEFIQSFPPGMKSCSRNVSEGIRTIFEDGREVPTTYYQCKVKPMTWLVVEERVFTTDPADNVSN